MNYKDFYAKAFDHPKNFKEQAEAIDWVSNLKRFYRDENGYPLV
jgi:hypothetical protein